MTQDIARLRSNPADFLEDAIKTHVRQSPLNRLRDLDGGPIFDEPLVGFAGGDDPLFEDYRTLIGDFHLTPRQVLASAEPEPASGSAGRATVVSIVLPLARAVRESNRRMTDGPSLEWNNARWHGEECATELIDSVAGLLRSSGFRAVVPDELPVYGVRDLPNGRCSNWSQRHAAYAAGLGTFSLSDGLITPKGIAVWCTSLVTNLEVPATPRPYQNHVANCPFFADGSCKACVERCPAGAISANGHDKLKCRETIHVTQKPWLARPGYIGKYAACGLCQTRVPCEGRIPARAISVIP